MPLLLLLDASLSLLTPEGRWVPADGGQLVTRWDLATQAVGQILDHLSRYSRLEFVALVSYSCQYEVVVDFTRDYQSIKEALKTIEVGGPNYTNKALRGAISYCAEEWGSAGLCQLVHLTDGSYSPLEPAPAPAPPAPPRPLLASLDVLCLCNSDGPGLKLSTAGYHAHVRTHALSGAVHAPEELVTRRSTEKLVSRMLALDRFRPCTGLLECGALSSSVSVVPRPQPHVQDGTPHRLPPSPTLRLVGFLPTESVSSPPAISRHLVLPTNKEGVSLPGSSVIVIGSEDEAEAEEAEDSGAPALCVLLHGGLKKENTVALVQLAPQWYGLLYSWSDSKKKSNLMLSVFFPGAHAVPWLGPLDQLGPLELRPAEQEGAPFPVKGGDKRSYSQPCVVWLRPGGIPSDVAKITRHARKLPDKVQSFYKEVNRVRRAALQYGFPALLRGLCDVLEREASALPPNAQAEGGAHLRHACRQLRAAAELAADPHRPSDTPPFPITPP